MFLRSERLQGDSHPRWSAEFSNEWRHICLIRSPIPLDLTTNRYRSIDTDRLPLIGRISTRVLMRSNLHSLLSLSLFASSIELRIVESCVKLTTISNTRLEAFPRRYFRRVKISAVSVCLNRWRLSIAGNHERDTKEASIRRDTLTKV